MQKVRSRLQARTCLPTSRRGSSLFCWLKPTPRAAREQESSFTFLPAAPTEPLTIRSPKTQVTATYHGKTGDTAPLVFLLNLAPRAPPREQRGVRPTVITVGPPTTPSSCADPWPLGRESPALPTASDNGQQLLIWYMQRTLRLLLSTPLLSSHMHPLSPRLVGAARSQGIGPLPPPPKSYSRSSSPSIISLLWPPRTALHTCKQAARVGQGRPGCTIGWRGKEVLVVRGEARSSTGLSRDDQPMLH